MKVEELRQVSMDKRLRWEKDAKGPVLVFDCANNTKEEAWQLLQSFDEAVVGQPQNSVRVLADFENAYHEPKLTAQWKANWEGHSDRVAKMACFNITGGMKVVLAAYRFFARLRGLDIEDRLRYFNDENAARAWLLED